MLRAFANGVWFTAVTSDDECRGCMFDSEMVGVCHNASAAAVRAGMPDCDVGCIYVRDPSDGRQADLLIGGEV